MLFAINNIDAAKADSITSSDNAATLRVLRFALDNRFYRTYSSDNTNINIPVSCYNDLNVIEQGLNMKILKKLQSRPTQDGDGVNISRIADFSAIHLDPYLMIDELRSDESTDFIGGFPPHPHRGIETFTYMIHGGFEHQDQMGNKRVIRDGDVQWMSTGSGVIHSEMPVTNEDEGMHGFQIWLNMPAKDKMSPARYQDTVETGVPVIQDKSGNVLKALAGEWHFDNQTITAELNDLAANGAIADLVIQPAQKIALDLSHYEQVLAFVHTGRLVGPDVARGELVILDVNTLLEATAGDKGASLLLLVGNKIKEKIVHMGPFVMNSQEEINQTIRDYQAGKFGELTL